MSNSKLLHNLFQTNLPIIGMIHLPPLLGYKKYPGMNRVVDKALSDLNALEKGGADGVMIENEYDQPHQMEVGPETIAAMTVVAQEVVKKAGGVVVGVEILLNDPKASLAIAKATHAKFIRTDYFVDKMAREEYGGEMKIDPQRLIAYRQKIKAQDILILADIQVKYAKMLEKKSLSASAKQAQQEKADAVIVTGKLTGVAPRIDDLKEAKKSVGFFPVLIGSGLTYQNASSLLQYADGAIVGTGIKTGLNIDAQKVKKLMSVVKKLRTSKK